MNRLHSQISPRTLRLLNLGVKLGCLLLSIAIIIFSFAGLTIAKAPFENLTNSTVNLFRSKSDEFPNSTIWKMRAIGKLYTLQRDVSAVVEVRSPLTILNLEEVLVYTACGQAIFGVDLTDLEAQDVTSTGTEITVALPRAELLAFNLDVTSGIEVHSFVNGYDEVDFLPVCNRIFSWEVPPLIAPKSELVQIAGEQAAIQLKAALEDEEIVELAQRNAEREIEWFLKLIGYNEVNFLEVEE